MSVHRAHGVVTGVPVGGLRRAAPQRELRIEQDVAGFAAQREMVHQNGRCHPVQFVQTGPGVLQSVPAPGVAGGIGLAGQQELVSGDHVAILGDRQALGLRPRSGGQERVVVEQEHRDYGRRTAAFGPHRIRVLRGENTHLVAHLHQVVVARAAEHLGRVLAGGPELMIAGNPDHLGESAPQQIQGRTDVVGAVGHVAGDDQPVLGGRRIQRLEYFLAAGMTGMQVADRPERGCHNSSAYWRGSPRPGARIV